MAAWCLLLAACAGVPTGGNPGAEVHAVEGRAITVATVSNPQMQDIQALSSRFTEETGITVRYISLPENQMRDRVTQDVATGGGQFDVVTIGTYETPIWAELGWISDLNPMVDQSPGYDVDDLMPTIRTALSVDDHLYAVPFYGESSFLMYREDLFEQAGLEMPEQPTWRQVAEFARELHDPAAGHVGICLRGLPGWGQVMAPLDTVVNTFGGRWFDQEWEPMLTEPPFEEAVAFYTDLVREAGEPGAPTSGFTECLTTYTQGSAAMWYDATVAAGLLEDPETSTVVGKNGYAFAPVEETDKSGWLWAWAFAIPAESRNQDAAWQFVSWATSKDYIRLVGEELGWARVPPGSRLSTYDIPEYRDAAGAFADITLESIRTAPIEQPTVDPVPYRGIQYVGIPEFQDLGTSVSQDIAAVIAGGMSVETALQRGEQAALLVVQEAGLRE